MKRGMLIGLIVGALAIVLLWYLVLFSPTSKDLDDTKSAVTASEAEQQDLAASLHRLKDLAKNAPQQQATLRRLDAAVPQAPDLAAFIIQANQIATESGIDWLAISPTPPAASATSTASVITVSIQVQGGFFQVLDYLNRLEDLERLVVVDNVNISSGGSATATAAGAPAATTSSSGSPDLSVTLTGRMFTRQSPATAPGATPVPTTPAPTTATTTAGST